MSKLPITKVDQKDLFDALHLLTDNQFINIEDEPEDSNISKALELVTLCHTIIEGTPYNIIYDVISRMPQPSYFEKGSVGERIFNKSTVCYGGDQKRCSPLTLNSIPEKDSIKYSVKSDICPDQIWVYKNGFYAALTSNNSNKAKLYLDKDEFTGLTIEEKEQFRKNNVDEIEVYILKETESNNKQEKELTNVLEQELTKLDDIKTITHRSNSKHKHHNDDCDNCYWIWILVLVFLIILFIIILFKFNIHKMLN